MRGMNKSQAVAIFDTVQALADAFGCTRQAIYKLPEQLPQGAADRVIGAAVRLGLLHIEPCANWPLPANDSVAPAAATA